jgi:membrane protein DedA with SNARE-associated domain
MAKSKRKQIKWFRPVRKSYLPDSLMGMLLYTAYVLYMGLLVIVWFERSHEVWTLLTIIVPLLVAATVVMQYIASKNS